MKCQRIQENDYVNIQMNKNKRSQTPGWILRKHSELNEIKSVHNIKTEFNNDVEITGRNTEIV